MNLLAMTLWIKVCPDKGGASGKGRGGHVLINHDIMNKEFVTVNREGMGWWCLNWGGGVLEDVTYSLNMISWICNKNICK